MIKIANNLNLLLTKMAYGVYDTYSVDERWLDGGPPWGKTKKQVAEDTKRFADEAKAQDLNLTFSSHRYGEGSMSPDEAIAKILKAKTKKDLMGYDKDLPYFYTLATQEPGFFNFLSERKPLDYDNHPLYKESSIKIANDLMSLVVNKQAAKSAGSGLKQRAADALRKYGPYSREYHGLIMKLTNEQLKQDHTNDDGVVDWDAYAKAKKYAAERREASKETSLHDWFSRKGETGSKGGWVDCNAPDGSGGYKTCGRSSGEERGEYPACRPTPGACKEKGRGDSWGKKSEEDKKKDDACTRKVKARYDVWPSAYASGALTKCRAVGADNWGNKTKESSIDISDNLMRLVATKRAESAAWQRSEGKNPEGGLNRKGVASYRAENPGSKLQMAVTKDPSKLDPDSKAAKRRKSFCARMGGMPGPMQDEKGRPTRKALSLRKWNC